MKNHISALLSAANLENLTGLWKIMGAHKIAGPADLYHCSNWPYRFWSNQNFSEASITQIEEILSKQPAHTIVPVWNCPQYDTSLLEPVLKTLGFQITFSQTAMMLDLTSCSEKCEMTDSIKSALSEEDLLLWTKVSSKAFGNAIDNRVIQKIATHPDIELWLMKQGTNAIATALTFQTDSAIGVHQLGVHPQYQGQGAGRKIMKFLIQRHLTNSHYMMLQASPMGEPLYLKLGFQPLFHLHNYQRIQP